MFNITWHVKKTNESYSTYDALNKLAIMYVKKEEKKHLQYSFFRANSVLTNQMKMTDVLNSSESFAGINVSCPPPLFFAPTRLAAIWKGQFTS